MMYTEKISTGMNIFEPQMVVKASVLSFTKAVASKCSVVTDILKNMSANSWGNNFTLHVCFCNKVMNLLVLFPTCHIPISLS